MADRQVTGTGKDADGDITSLCGAWGSVTKATAIAEIDSGTHRYFVAVPGGGQVDVYVVDGPTGRYLRTDPDGRIPDNLDDLPDC